MSYIGESSYCTEKKEAILVPLEEPMTGIEGILIFKVMLKGRMYEKIGLIFNAQIGKLIIDQSTNNLRTMSPWNKTPIFLLICNLSKINKSQIN